MKISFIFLSLIINYIIFSIKLNLTHDKCKKKYTGFILYLSPSEVRILSIFY